MVVGKAEKAIWLLAVVSVLPSASLAKCPFASMMSSSASSPHRNNGREDTHSLGNTDILKSIPVDEESSTVPLEGEIPQANNKSDPLVRINNWFHDLYDASGATLRPDPVIVLEGDYLVLRFNNGTREKQQITPMVFHNLKMICHIPLVAFVDLWPPLRASLPKENERLQSVFSRILRGTKAIPNSALGSTDPVTIPNKVADDMKALLSNISEYRESILRPTRFEGEEQLERQVAIVHETENFLNTILSRTPPTVTLNEFLTFTRGISEDLSKNLDDAAAGQVNMLNDAFVKWNATYGLTKLLLEGFNKPDPLRHLRVAITTSHMARTQALAAQYFSRFFGVNINRNDRYVDVQKSHRTCAVCANYGCNMMGQIYDIGTIVYRGASIEFAGHSPNRSGHGIFLLW
eukprot:gb/GECG01010131.1/.p1 GENE.gb/GECG01010131.1/~~gb/GECG01010131.1/.p1  ORF type:complete len:405 (+),score=41.94 gb/GECG01010131.1/:1-1215(+)